MVLSSIRLALNDDAKSDVNKLLFATGEHNNVTLSSGDKRNISGLLICHPILLDSPFVELAGIDQLLNDLLLERHPYTVAQANDGSGSYESDKAHVKIATIKSHRTHFTCTCGISYRVHGKTPPMFSLR